MIKTHEDFLILMIIDYASLFQSSFSFKKKKNSKHLDTVVGSDHIGIFKIKKYSKRSI